MDYQALYRMYRPQSFDDVVGQTHVTKTLRNAISKGKQSHAYIFSGPRGTVKLVLQRFLPKLLIVLIVTMVNLVMNVRFVKESHKVRITM